MMTTDPIADFLTRIRNAYLARQTETTIPYSRLKEELATILKNSGYVKKVEVIAKDPTKKSLHITLNYQGKFASVNGIERLSTPGRRLYTASQDLKPVLAGQGLTIISTSKGLMTDREARKANIGGELLCKVW